MRTGIYRGFAPSASRDYPSAFLSVRGDLLPVGPLDQHPGLALGARVAHQHAPFPVERLLHGGDRLLHVRDAFERTLLLHGDVELRLRHRLEAAGELRERLLVVQHHREQVERRAHPVAGRHVIEEDEVPRLLPAEVVPGAAHLVDDVAIAHLRADDSPADLAQGALQPHVAHDGRHHRLLGEQPLPEEVAADDGHDGVAVHDPALLVGHDDAVGVAVEARRRSRR
jgi:hypothetical protein